MPGLAKSAILAIARYSKSFEGPANVASATQQVTYACGCGALLRQLQEAHLSSHVPGLPHGVVMGWGQAGVGEGGAGRGPHDALCKQEVAK